MKFLTWQNSEQLFVAQNLNKVINYSAAELRNITIMKKKSIILLMYMVWFCGLAIQAQNYESENDVRSSNRNRDKTENFFWFPKYAKINLDNNGEPITSSARWEYPGDECGWEIEIRYNNSKLYPISIYLNRVKGENYDMLIESEFLGSINTLLDSSVKIADEKITINIENHQIVFTEGGDITIASLNHGSFAGGVARMFESSKLSAKILYPVSYKELKKNLEKHFQNK